MENVTDHLTLCTMQHVTVITDIIRADTLSAPWQNICIHVNMSTHFYKYQYNNYLALVHVTTSSHTDVLLLGPDPSNMMAKTILSFIIILHLSIHYFSMLISTLLSHIWFLRALDFPALLSFLSSSLHVNKTIHLPPFFCFFIHFLCLSPVLLSFIMPCPSNGSR